MAGFFTPRCFDRSGSSSTRIVRQLDTTKNSQHNFGAGCKNITTSAVHVTAFNLVQFFDKLDRAFDEVADTSSKNTARDPVPISALNQALYDLAQEKPTKLLSSSLRAVLFLRDV